MDDCFLEDAIPECLQQSWIVQKYENNKEAIQAMLNSKIDYAVLQELKNASSLVEVPNRDKKPDITKLQKMFENAEETAGRNKKIVQAYEKGFSQHMIAKVLGLNQATVQRIIKRNR